MSYYYSYYIGYKHEGKIYPLGPYNCFGSLKPVVERSSSFASDLHELFCSVQEKEISEELRKEFEFEHWTGEKRCIVNVCKISDLPVGSFVKSGYYLIDDVRSYEAEESADTMDIFYDTVSPTVYAAMVDNELRFGKPKPVKDEFGNEYQPNSASDYMFYAYPDYHCREYEAHMILEAADGLYSYTKIPKGATLVALETGG